MSGGARHSIGVPIVARGREIEPRLVVLHQHMQRRGGCFQFMPLSQFAEHWTRIEAMMPSSGPLKETSQRDYLSSQRPGNFTQFAVHLNPRSSAGTLVSVNLQQPDWYEQICTQLQVSELVHRGRPIREFSAQELSLLQPITPQSPIETGTCMINNQHKSADYHHHHRPHHHHQDMKRKKCHKCSFSMASGGEQLCPHLKRRQRCEPYLVPEGCRPGIYKRACHHAKGIMQHISHTIVAQVIESETSWDNVKKTLRNRNDMNKLVSSAIQARTSKSPDQTTMVGSALRLTAAAPPSKIQDQIVKEIGRSIGQMKSNVQDYASLKMRTLTFRKNRQQALPSMIASALIGNSCHATTNVAMGRKDKEHHDDDWMDNLSDDDDEEEDKTMSGGIGATMSEDDLLTPKERQTLSETPLLLQSAIYNALLRSPSGIYSELISWAIDNRFPASTAISSSSSSLLLPSAASSSSSPKLLDSSPKPFEPVMSNLPMPPLEYEDGNVINESELESFNEARFSPLAPRSSSLQGGGRKVQKPLSEPELGRELVKVFSPYFGPPTGVECSDPSICVESKRKFSARPPTTMPPLEEIKLFERRHDPLRYDDDDMPPLDEIKLFGRREPLRSDDEDEDDNQMPDLIESFIGDQYHLDNEEEEGVSTFFVDAKKDKDPVEKARKKAEKKAKKEAKKAKKAAEKARRKAEKAERKQQDQQRQYADLLARQGVSTTTTSSPVGDPVTAATTTIQPATHVASLTATNPSSTASSSSTVTNPSFIFRQCKSSFDLLNFMKDKHPEHPIIRALFQGDAPVAVELASQGVFNRFQYSAVMNRKDAKVLSKVLSEMVSVQSEAPLDSLTSTHQDFPSHCSFYVRSS